MQIKFPSKWVKAEDIGDEMVVTIKAVDYDESDDKGLSYFIKFAEFPEKKWTMNVTNFRTIAKVLGSEDSDDWLGKQITLYTTEVQFAGETMLGIRVRLKKPAAAQGSAVVAAAASVPFGEAGEKWVIEQVAKAFNESKGDPVVTIDNLRVALAGANPQHEAVIASEPRNWPRSLRPAVEKWCEESSVPF